MGCNQSANCNNCLDLGLDGRTQQTQEQLTEQIPPTVSKQAYLKHSLIRKQDRGEITINNAAGKRSENSFPL